jgi:hypothetical protein
VEHLPRLVNLGNHLKGIRSIERVPFFVRVFSYR